MVKWILILSLTYFSAWRSVAQDFVVSAPVAVAPGYGNYHPQTEILGDQQPGIIWTNSTTNHLYFSKRTGEQTFSTPVQLNPTGTQVQDYNWSGPDLCAEGSNVYVAYHDLGYETGHIYLVKSTDYGLTFGDTVRIDNLTDAYPQFPDVAVLNDTIYVAYMKHGMLTMNPQMVLSRSVDGGQSFEPFVDATAWVGAEACDCCQPELIVDNQRIVIFYRQNSANTRDIKAVVSYDRGLTFSNQFSPDDHNWTISACPSTGPDARFLENGHAVCAYRTTVAGQPKLFVNEYDLLAGSTVDLTDIYMTGASNSGINYPQFAVSGSLIGLVWEGLGTGTDVFFNASDAGVNNLLPDRAINVTNLAGSQSKPDIAILNGAFHIFYAELSGAEVKYVRINPVNGLEERTESLTIFPNPATDRLRIAYTSGSDTQPEYRVFDALGRQMTCEAISWDATHLEIDVSGLSDGTYTLILTASNRDEVVRFVKM